LSARRTSEHIVIIIIIERLNGVGLGSSSSSSGGDIPVELHCAAPANAGGDEEEGEYNSCEARYGYKRSRRSTVSV
jgi:hypothetical protein